MSAAEALAPEQSVSEVRESLSVTEKGQPANTIGNCRTVFCHDPLLRGAIRLNLLTDRVDIVRDLGWRRNTSALTDTDVKYLLLYFEQNYGLTSEKKMTAALSIVANENCYHPIQDVLNGLTWDGTPRIRSCLQSFLRCGRERLCGGNGDGLEAVLQSEDVRRIWQAEGLGTGRFRQRTVRQRRWICGVDRGRMPPAGTSEGVDRLKMVVCCRAGCHLVAGFVAGDFPVWIRKKPVNKAFSTIYFYHRQRKQRDFSRKLIK